MKLNNYNVDETDDGKLRVSGLSINDKEVAAPEGDLLTVNGAWYLEAYPSVIVAEKADGTLSMFHVTPFRRITEADMKPYKAYHPRKCKGQPLPEYLYKFYGLCRNDEILSEVIRVRLSPTEKDGLEMAARSAGKTVSEFLRDRIRGL